MGAGRGVTRGARCGGGAAENKIILTGNEKHQFEAATDSQLG